MAENILKGTIKIEAPGVKETASEVSSGVTRIQNSLKTIPSVADNANGKIIKLNSSLETLRAKLEAKKQFLLTETDISKIAAYNREIVSLKTQIDKIQTLGVGESAFGKIGVGATEAFSSLRKLAYILPGIGVAGLLGDLSSLVVELFKGSNVLDTFNSKLGLTKQVAVDSSRVFGQFDSIFAEATKNVAEEAVKLEVYKQKLNDVNIPASDRLKILKQYNSIADDTNKIDATQINNLDLINQKIDAQNSLIVKRALSTAALSKLTEASNKLIENEVKLQEQLSVRGFKDLPDYEKQANSTDKATKKIKASLNEVAQQKLLNPKGLPEIRKGLDGVIDPSQKAAQGFNTTESSLQNLINTVKKGRADLEKLAGNLSGLITIDGLTDKKTQDKTSPKHEKVNFFDDFLDFDPKNVKADTQNAVKAYDIFLKYALANQKTKFGLDDILKIESKPAAIKAAAEWWEAYSKAWLAHRPDEFVKYVPSLDVKPKISLDKQQIEQDSQKGLKELSKNKIDVNPTIRINVNEALINDYEAFKSIGERIGRTIGGGFDEAFKKIFDDTFKQALSKGLSGDALENFKSEFEVVSVVAAQGIQGIAAAFGNFTDAILSGKNGMQAFGEAIKGVFKSIAIEIIRDIVLAGILSALTGGSANGGLSFLGALGKIVGGSHATGLKRVPKDGYIAELHRGEMVVPARQAEALRSVMNPDFSIPSISGFQTPAQIKIPSFSAASFSNINSAANSLRAISKQTLEVAVSGEFTQRGDHLVAVVNREQRKQNITI